MSDSNDAHDRRQLELMSSRIRLFESGKIPLSTLINDLDALLLALHTVDSYWIDAFKNHWGTLEQLHAGALDEGHSTIPQHFAETVNEAIAGLKEQLSQAGQRQRS